MTGTVIKGEHGEDVGGRRVGPGGQFGFMGRAMGSHRQVESRAEAGITRLAPQTSPEMD